MVSPLGAIFEELLDERHQRELGNLIIAIGSFTQDIDQTIKKHEDFKYKKRLITHKTKLTHYEKVFLTKRNGWV